MTRIYKVYDQDIQVVTGVGYVSGHSMSKMIHCYVYVNVQGQLNGYIFCVWRIGLLTTSKRDKMIIASFIPIMRPIVNCVSIVYRMNLSMKAGCTRFWILAHFNRHMLSSSTLRYKTTKKSSINILYHYKKTSKSSSAGTTHHKSSWKTLVSAEHIAHYSTIMACYY